MTFDTSLAAIVRASSLGLYFLAGVLMVAQRPHRPLGVLLGVHFIAFAVLVATSNVAYAEAGGLALMTIATFVGVLAMVALVVDFLRPVTRRVRLVAWSLFLAVALLGVVVLAWALPARFSPGFQNPVFGGPIGPEIVPLGVSYGFLAIVWDALVLLLTAAVIEHVRSGAPSPARARGLLLAVAPQTLWLSFFAGELLHAAANASDMVQIGVSLAISVPSLGALWFLRLTAGVERTLARNLLLGAFACLAVGALFDPLEDYGAIGILRVALFAFLILALIRYDLLGIPLHRIAVARGTLASAGLATLFITAQVAQNFLSDKLGLIVGGIVAGAVVFAAFPLQRAAERIVERRPSSSSGGPVETYRAQSLLAWRDGKLAANERLMLRDLRIRLEIDPDVAEEIDHEVASLHAARAPRRRRSAEGLSGSSRRS